jgi:hypothetical protein
VRLLFDTNVFLEVILGQEAAAEAKAVLGTGASHALFVTDYSVHSIGLLLFRRGRPELLQAVVDDIIRGGITPISVPLEELPLVVGTAQKTGFRRFRPVHHGDVG